MEKFLVSRAESVADSAPYWLDRSGVYYSKDRKHLLQCRNDELETYVVAEGTQVIMPYAFHVCKSLVSIKLPNSLVSIENGAFYECKSLKSISLPDGLVSIKNHAFSNCKSLTALELPESLREMGDNPFQNDVNLQLTSKSPLFKIENNLLIHLSELVYVGKQDSVIVPDYVTSIRKDAFFYNGLTTLKLSDNITHIDSYTFTEFDNLVSVDLPGKLVSIGISTFSGCKRLAAITLPDGLTSIGMDAFGDCKCIETLELPATLCEMGSNPFAGIKKLHLTSKSPYFTVENNLLIQDKKVIAAVGNPFSVYIPDYITSIGSSAFDCCSRLRTIKLPGGLMSIEDSAFSHCTRLKSITFPESLVSIGDYSFQDCRNLTTVLFSEGLLTIGYSAFNGCTNLSTVKLPDSLISIYNEAFTDCDRLSAITLPVNLRDIKGHSFERDIQITNKSAFLKIENDLLICGNVVVAAIGNPISVNFPDYITSIADHAFEGCTLLTEITFPEGVTSIGDDVFNDCFNMTSVSLPASLTSVSRSAFFGLNRLVHVIMPYSLIKIDGLAECFEFNSMKLYLTCPANSDKKKLMEKAKRLLPENLYNEIILIDE